MLAPGEWGMVVKGNRLFAIHTNKPSAPDRLLSVIRWNCKAYCKTSNCSCRKHGLTSPQMCSECKGIIRLNSVQIDDTDNNEDTEQ